MAIGQSKRAISNLITASNGNLTVATYAQVREALNTLFKDTYGSDIDLSSASADGVLVMNLALMINNMLQSINYLYSALDVNQATGKYLDRLCALANVYRKSATSSTATLTISIPSGSSETSVTIPNGFEALDQNGNTWIYSGSDAVVTSTSPLNIVVSCEETGQVAADPGWINSVVDASLNITVTNEKAATLGEPAESDSALRARKNQTSGNYGASVLEILKGSLLNITGIEDVYVYNNITGSSQVMNDGVTVNNHDVYIAIRISPGVTIGYTVDGTSNLIGDLIYRKMTPGIATTDATGCTYGTARSYFFEDPSVSESQASAFATYARWKEVEEVPLTVNLTLSITNNFSGNVSDVSSWNDLSGTALLICNAAEEYISSLSIGTDLTPTGLINAIEDADPGYRGRSTFDITALSVRRGTDAAVNFVTSSNIIRSAKVENPVSYFSLATTVDYAYVWNEDDGTVTIKLGG